MIKSTDKMVAKNIYCSLAAIYTHTKKTDVVVAVVKKALPVLRTLLDVPKVIDIRIAPVKGNSTGRCYYGGSDIELDCRMVWDQALEVLAHEMVHAEQFHTGRLEWVDSKRYGTVYKYNGVKYDKISNTQSYASYLELPWEKEAFGRQKELADKVIAILGD